MPAVLPVRSAALLFALLPAAAPAQQASWWDVLAPDRVAESLVMSAIGAARTQADITYGDLSVDLLSSRMALTDLTIWPFFDWDENGECEIRVDRAVLTGSPLGEMENARAHAAISGLRAEAACLPPEARGTLGMAGLDGLDLSHVSVRADFHMPSAGLDLAVSATAPGFAAAMLDAAFNYIWFEIPPDGSDEPLPVAFLEHAVISIENLGGWDTLQAQLPPQVTNPASAGLMIEGGLAAMLAGMNSEAAGPDAGPEAGALSTDQQALVTSASEAWAAFLAAPERMVLETQDAIVFIDTELWSENPRLAFEDLKPMFSTTTAAARSTVPRATLQAWRDGNAGTLGAEERKALAEALLAGVGAPRDIRGGVLLLTELSDAGDTEAAGLIAAALESREPAVAYAWGLRAGAQEQTGATARLDRIEAGLPFAEILRIQAAHAAALPAPPPSGAALAEAARAAMTGHGTSRSYANAAVLARLASATGAPEGQALLAELDDFTAARDAEGRTAWAAVEVEAARRSLTLWLDAGAR